MIEFLGRSLCLDIAAVQIHLISDIKVRRFDAAVRGSGDILVNCDAELLPKISV